MKIKISITVVCVWLMMACQTDSLENFDHAEQYNKEKTSINNYLATHYYNSATDTFEDLVDGEIALANDEKLVAIETTFNEVNYTMYVYETVEGIGANSPDENDEVNIHYRLTSLENKLFEEENKHDAFLDISTLIRGWQVGLSSFKEGTYDEASNPTAPREYTGAGEGFLLIPSGLAYQNFGNGDIPPNETLLFKIVLRTVIPIE